MTKYKPTTISDKIIYNFFWGIGRIGGGIYRFCHGFYLGWKHGK